MNSPKEMAQLITKLTKSKGVSINKMLLECGVGKSLLDNMKRGQEPSAIKLKLVADYLNTSADYLLTGKEEKKKGVGANMKGSKINNKDMIRGLNALFYDQFQTRNLITEYDSDVSPLSERTASALAIHTGISVDRLQQIAKIGLVYTLEIDESEYYNDLPSADEYKRLFDAIRPESKYAIYLLKLYIMEEKGFLLPELTMDEIEHYEQLRGVYVNSILSIMSINHPVNDMNTKLLISIYDSFDNDLDKVEFIGRARKLARDMKTEIAAELAPDAKGKLG